MRNFVTVKEVSEELGVSPRTVKAKIGRGELPPLTITGDHSAWHRSVLELHAIERHKRLQAQREVETDISVEI